MTSDEGVSVTENMEIGKDNSLEPQKQSRERGRPPMKRSNLAKKGAGFKGSEENSGSGKENITKIGAVAEEKKPCQRRRKMKKIPEEGAKEDVGMGNEIEVENGVLSVNKKNKSGQRGRKSGFKKISDENIEEGAGIEAEKEMENGDSVKKKKNKPGKAKTRENGNRGLGQEELMNMESEKDVGGSKGNQQQVEDSAEVMDIEKGNAAGGEEEKETKGCKSDARAFPRRQSSQKAIEKIGKPKEQRLEWDEEVSRNRSRKKKILDNEGHTEDNMKKQGKNAKDEERREEDGEEENVKLHTASSRTLRPEKVKNEDELSVQRIRMKKDENGNEVESNMCHQCQRNDKGRVVRCTSCKTKRYCVPCMTRWYPGVQEEAFAEKCPVCLQNCNCKSCLRFDGPIKASKKSKFEVSDEEKIQYSKYILQVLLPLLRRFNAEQMIEKEIEAKIQGGTVSELKLQEAKCQQSDRMYWYILQTPCLFETVQTVPMTFALLVAKSSGMGICRAM